MTTTPAKPFHIRAILKQSYGLLYGSKWAIWIGVILLVLISTLTSAIIFLIAKQNPAHYDTLHFISLLISTAISSPVLAALFLVGAKRSRGEVVHADIIISYFKRFIPLACAAVILFIIREITSGFVVLHPNQSPYMIILAILTLIVSVFLMLTLPLVADKELNPFKAMITSIKKVSGHWFKVLLLVILMGLGFILTYAITLGLCVLIIHGVAMLLNTVALKAVLISIVSAVALIMSIWLVPYCFVVSGVMYHELVD